MSVSNFDRIRSLCALIAILVWGGAACATGGASPEAAEDGPPPAERATRVQVENDHTSDMVIYVLADGQYSRLGNVTAHQRADLTLPRHVVNASDVRFAADPIGSRTAYLSERVLFSAGDVVALTIGSSLNLSSVSVRSGDR